MLGLYFRFRPPHTLKSSFWAYICLGVSESLGKKSVIKVIITEIIDDRLFARILKTTHPN